MGLPFGEKGTTAHEIKRRLILILTFGQHDIGPEEK